MLMRDTEKRPCTVGVWPCESKGVFAGVVLRAGDFPLGVLTLGVSGLLPTGDFAGVLFKDLGDFFAGDGVLGEAFLGVAAFFPGKGDLDF